jgi:hypothetical protein
MYLGFRFTCFERVRFTQKHRFLEGCAKASQAKRLATRPGSERRQDDENAVDDGTTEGCAM